MRFYKYHALGNDYIVLNPADFPAWGAAPSTAQIRVVCHRNFGVGSDGILWGPLPSEKSDCGLRIFNPDGSEAENPATACASLRATCGTPDACAKTAPTAPAW